MFGLSMCLTSCEDILGHWEKPTPTNVTPSGGGDDDGGGSSTEPTMLQTPLTFEAAEAEANVTFTIDNVATGQVEFSTDGTNWAPYISATPIVLTAIGDKVSFRGTNAAYANNTQNSSITCDKECYIYGNIMSLIKAEGFENETTFTADYTFKRLFYDNAKIKNHTDATKYLVLPATKMTVSCYEWMFRGCTGLTTTPVIDVDCDGKANCLYYMFAGCTELTKVDDNSKIDGIMGSTCCTGMFRNCTKLESVPSELLPSTNLATGCYQYMFEDCIALTKAPKLPTASVYQIEKCYNSMFKGCTNLNEVWVKADYKDTDNYFECSYMFNGVTAANNASSKFYTDGDWDTWKTAFANINAWTKDSYTPAP